MRKIAPYVLFLAISLCFSSCFLFQKTSKQKLPEPPKKEKVENKLPKEQQENEEKVSENKNKKETFFDVALFVPLDIDNVVGADFKVGERKELPTSTLNGLSFYEGALMAFDSLRAQGIPVRLHVFDSRSEKEPVRSLIQKGTLDSMDLMIGAVGGASFKKIAGFAKKNKVNFVSATYPNDGGVTDNPYLFLVNSTIHIHCVAIQSFVQKKFGKKKITVIYKKNAQGERSLSYLKEAYRKMSYFKKAPLNSFEWKETKEDSIDDLISQLQKGKKNVIILTTLYPDLSLDIIEKLMPYVNDYKISIVGMPTLDGLSRLKNKKYHGIDIYYGTVFPYENLGKYPIMKNVMWKYFAYYHARPSKEALNGYETMFYFGHFLDEKGKKSHRKINNTPGHLATAFSFQPIYGDNEKKPDYYENTRIYFLHERNGEVTPAN